VDGLRSDFPPLNTADAESARGFPRRRALLAAAVLAAVAAAVAVAVVVRGGSAKPLAVPPDSVGVIDPRTDRVVGHVAVDASPVWAATGSFSQVSRIAPGANRVVASFDASAAPTSMATGAGGLWVADSFANTVTRIDPRFDSVVATIPVGRVPSDVAFG